MTPQLFRRSLTVFGALAALTLAPAAWAQGAHQADSRRAIERGERLIQAGRYKEASVELERASQLAGGPCPDCLLGVGRAYSGARQYPAALQVTRMALALYADPHDQARAYDQLGTILALQGEMDASREAFGKAVELDGRMARQVRASLAQALLQRASYAQKEKAAAAAATVEEVVATVATPQR